MKAQDNIPVGQIAIPQPMPLHLYPKVQPTVVASGTPKYGQAWGMAAYLANRPTD